jgi:phenylpropionate dioxygenase-like ring-hydroxylating dioxygenase large terminal subunit
MLTKEENDLLTRTGPGTPCGELMRRYWQPAALSEELPPGGAPVPIRLFSEDLVLFRDEQGRPGLLGLHCAHRGADLSYGRLEDGGLRCIYHGWLYDIHGRCLEQPGEPPSIADFGLRIAESTSVHSPIRNPHSAIKHLAYPCEEVGGIIYTYMGPGEPPLLPPYEFVRVPEEYRANAKFFQECNYQQGREGTFDPVHLSFLHRLATDDPESPQALNTECVSPVIEAEETDYGARIYCVRRVHGDRSYVRVTNYILPNLCAVSGTDDGYQTLWHVPIDDTHHWRYTIWFSRSEPRPARYFSRSDEFTADYRLVRNKSNRYLQDRESMKTAAYSGLGANFLPHDVCVTEGAGPIQDRTQEHLGSTDKGVVVARLVLLRAIRDVQDGREAPAVVRDPDSQWAPRVWARSDVLLPSDVDWRRYWENESAQAQLATVVG